MTHICTESTFLFSKAKVKPSSVFFFFFFGGVAWMRIPSQQVYGLKHPLLIPCGPPPWTYTHSFSLLWNDSLSELLIILQKHDHSRLVLTPWAHLWGDGVCSNCDNMEGSKVYVCVCLCVCAHLEIWAWSIWLWFNQHLDAIQQGLQYKA